MSNSAAQPIPAYLEIPPQAMVVPPVETSLQKLPFDELAWQDFERLCLRLARVESDVEHCQLYGTAGQDQEGIDLYARLKTTGAYRVYQCKRVKDFDPPKIKKAVEKFLQGAWAARAQQFILCTSESMVPAERAEELEKQHAELARYGIELIFWGSDQLAVMLKEMPKLVDDFFGREWVKQFCGVQPAEKLGRRLDAGEVIKFRAEFKSFYQKLFDRHDRGIQVGTGLLPLSERYVVPDLAEGQQFLVDSDGWLAGEMADEEPTQSADHPLRRKHAGAVEPASKARYAHPRRRAFHQQRHKLGDWLSSTERSVILGVPGSGKSALLRFIALDLLSDAPRLPELAQRWGLYLPIWIPFAWWTKEIAKPDECSLKEMLHRWLKRRGEEALWPLAEQALEDRRLLLLVDGLDEWREKEHAVMALDDLQHFIERRNLPALVTSRPDGFKRLNMPVSDWRVGWLADLTMFQQRAFAQIWFQHHQRTQPSATHVADAEQETNDLLPQLSRSPDLQELAKTPLLLGALVKQHIGQGALSHNRFKAYHSIIEELVESHPRNRRRAAKIADHESLLYEGELWRVLARLAFKLQEDHGEGMIEERAARAILRKFLRNKKHFAFNQGKAKDLARAIVEVDEHTSGLLVKRSPTEVAFFHRAFQEYLAGDHLSTLPLEKQRAYVRRHCTDPQWRETLLALLSKTNRTDEIEQFIEDIRAHAPDALARQSTHLLLGEIACGNFNCPPLLARELVDELCREVELGSRLTERAQLLQQLMAGLRSSKVKEQVQQKLMEWFPAREAWRLKSLLAEMSHWPCLPDVAEGLIRAMHGEDDGCQRQAAHSLADAAAGDAAIGDHVAELAAHALEPTVRAVALEGLLRGWPEQREIKAIVEHARSSPSPPLRLLGICGRVKLQTQNDDDLTELFRLGDWRSELGYHWNDLIVSVLLEGWPKQKQVRDHCLRALEQSDRQQALDDHLAARVLVEGFADDEVVAASLARSLREPEGSASLSVLGAEGWDLLAKNFKGNQTLAAAFRQTPNKSVAEDWNRIAYGSLLAGTPAAKARLIECLKDEAFARPLYAWALLEGWGMQDAAVAAALRTLVFGEPEEYRNLADLLPRILTDLQEYRARLGRLFEGRDRDFKVYCLLNGLDDIQEYQQTEDLSNLLAEYAEERQQRGAEVFYLEKIFSLFPHDPRMRQVAKAELKRSQGNYAAVAAAYGDDAEIRKELIALANPLPAPLRQLIARQIGEGSGEEEFVLALLQPYEQDGDDEVLTQGSIAYHTRLKAAGKNLQPALQQLSRTLVTGGLNNMPARRAALAGCLTLQQLVPLQTATEPHGQRAGEPARIVVCGEPIPHLPLLNLILQNWGALKYALGDGFWERLTSHFSDAKYGRRRFWNDACLLANEYPVVRDEALVFVEANGARDVNLLRFLALARPKSALLLENCLAALRTVTLQNLHDAQLVTAAAELLGRHFRGEAGALQKLLAGRALPPQAGVAFDESLIIALCEGWPDSPALHELFLAAQSAQPKLSLTAYLYLISEKSGSQLVFDQLRLRLKQAEQEGFVRRLPLVRPLIRRMRKDEKLAELVTDHLLRHDSTASEQASLTRLLAAARGLSAELQAWCQTQLAAQTAPDAFPLIGFDIIGQELTPVAHALLEVLDGQPLPIA